MSKVDSGHFETSPYLLRRPRSLQEVLELREKRSRARKNTPQVTLGGIVVPLRTIQKKHDHPADSGVADDVGAEVLARFRRVSEGKTPSRQQTPDPSEKLDHNDIVRRLDKFAVLLRGVGSVGLAQRIERRVTDIRNLPSGSGDGDA